VSAGALAATAVGGLLDGGLGSGFAGALPHLAAPGWLAALALLPLLAWRHHRSGLGAITYSRLPAGASRAWRLHLPFYARLGALALVLLALARPQLGYAWEESRTAGIDIAIALDTSVSMSADDFHPDRLAVARRVMREFVGARAGDRIALVTFAGTALTRSPLTSDRRMLDELVSGLEISSTLDGTAIGIALASAARRLQDAGGKSRVIVLVTDGMNNAGEIDPLAAAAVCDGLGIRVYAVGVGTKGRVKLAVKLTDPRTGATAVEEMVMDDQLDEELLRRIADRTGGRFFRATDAGALAGIFAEIDRLEKTEREVKRYVRYQEAFMPLAWGALALLLAPLALTALRITAEP
jgi:Ca-activated chloride channel family protein